MGIIKSNNVGEATHASMPQNSVDLKKCLNYGETEYSLIVLGHHNTCGKARAVDYTQQDAWKK